MSNALAVNDQNFEEEVLKSAIPVLVDFWAPWCGPCKAISPTIDTLAAEYAGKIKVVKMNTDETPMTASKFGIMSIPTLMVFKDGQKVIQKVGAWPKEDIVKMLDAALA